MVPKANLGGNSILPYYDIFDLMLGTYVNIELANPLTKRTLLVIG